MKPGGEESRETMTTGAEVLRYEPPAIEWEEPLATVARFAAACAHRPLQSQECDLGGINQS